MVKFPKFEGGKILTNCLNSYQNIWEQEFKQIYSHAKQMKDKNKRNQFFTNYCTSVEEEGVKLVRGLTDDCMWYFANVNPLKPNETEFYPLVDLEEYTHKFGYSYKRTTDGASISKNDVTYTITMPSGMRDEFGQIKRNNEVIVDKLYARYKDNLPYIDFNIAIENFAESTIAPIKFSDYLPKNNILPWLIPTIIVPPVAVGGSLIFYFFFYKKRQLKVVTKQ